MTAPKLTEAIVTALLRQRFTASGNGGSGEYAFLAQVRNGAAFNATRTFDAMALNLWPSRGLDLHVFEVKVSRSDWKSELAKPDKAEDACRIADRFSVVAPTGVVKDGELPSTWGLIEVTGQGTDEKPWRLREKVAAPFIGPPRDRRQFPPIPRGLVVSMLRAAPGAVPGGKVPSASDLEIEAARRKGIEEGRAIEARHQANRGDLWAAEKESWNALRDALIEAGLTKWQANGRELAQHAARIAGAVQEGRNDSIVRQAHRALVDAAARLEAIMDPG